MAPWSKKKSGGANADGSRPSSRNFARSTAIVFAALVAFALLPILFGLLRLAINGAVRFLTGSFFASCVSAWWGMDFDGLSSIASGFIASVFASLSFPSSLFVRLSIWLAFGCGIVGLVLIATRVINRTLRKVKKIPSTFESAAQNVSVKVAASVVAVLTSGTFAYIAAPYIKRLWEKFRTRKDNKLEAHLEPTFIDKAVDLIIVFAGSIGAFKGTTLVFSKLRNLAFIRSAVVSILRWKDDVSEDFTVDESKIIWRNFKAERDAWLTFLNKPFSVWFDDHLKAMKPRNLRLDNRRSVDLFDVHCEFINGKEGWKRLAKGTRRKLMRAAVKRVLEVNPANRRTLLQAINDVTMTIRCDIFGEPWANLRPDAFDEERVDFQSVYSAVKNMISDHSVAIAVSVIATVVFYYCYSHFRSLSSPPKNPDAYSFDDSALPETVLFDDSDSHSSHGKRKMRYGTHAQRADLALVQDLEFDKQFGARECASALFKGLIGTAPSFGVKLESLDFEIDEDGALVTPEPLLGSIASIPAPLPQVISVAPPPKDLPRGGDFAPEALISSSSIIPGPKDVYNVVAGKSSACGFVMILEGHKCVLTASHALGAFKNANLLVNSLLYPLTVVASHDDVTVLCLSHSASKELKQSWGDVLPMKYTFSSSALNSPFYVTHHSGKATSGNFLGAETHTELVSYGRHSCSTEEGWSGAPVRRGSVAENGHVIGIHVSSGKDGVYNRCILLSKALIATFGKGIVDYAKSKKGAIPAPLATPSSAATSSPESFRERE